MIEFGILTDSLFPARPMKKFSPDMFFPKVQLTENFFI